MAQEEAPAAPSEALHRRVHGSPGQARGWRPI